MRRKSYGYNHFVADEMAWVKPRRRSAWRRFISEASTWIGLGLLAIGCLALWAGDLAVSVLAYMKRRSR